jgi:hypothetical protein
MENSKKTGLFVVVDDTGHASRVHQWTPTDAPPASPDDGFDAHTYLLGPTRVTRTGPLRFLTPDGRPLRVTLHTPLQHGLMVNPSLPPSFPCRRF